MTPPPVQKTDEERKEFQEHIAAESIRSAVALAKADVRLRDQEERIRAIEFERRILGR